MKTKVFTILAVIMFLSIFPAQAALITIEIEAIVDSVDDKDNYLEGQISPGDTITGFYIYDTDTPDTSPYSYIGHYQHYDAPAGISLSVGGFDFRTNPENIDFLVGIVNDGTSGDDGYWLVSYNNLPLSNGTLVDSIVWQLNDPTGSAISSAALPTSAPVLEDWQSIVGLRLEGDRAFLVIAHVTSAIPEPVSILLLGLGSLFLRKKS